MTLLTNVCKFPLKTIYELKLATRSYTLTQDVLNNLGKMRTLRCTKGKDITRVLLVELFSIFLLTCPMFGRWCSMIWFRNVICEIFVSFSVYGDPHNTEAYTGWPAMGTVLESILDEGNVSVWKSRYLVTFSSKRYQK